MVMKMTATEYLSAGFRVNEVIQHDQQAIIRQGAWDLAPHSPPQSFPGTRGGGHEAVKSLLRDIETKQCLQTA